MEEHNRPPSEVYIHTAIYRIRPDVFSVAHLHSPAIIELSVAGKEYMPVINRGSFFSDGIPVYDTCHNINTDEKGRNLAKELGRQRAVIMRGHGSVVVGENLKAVLFGSLFSELNARYQISSYRMGVQPHVLSEHEKAEASRIWGQRLYEKVWNYYVHKADIDL